VSAPRTVSVLFTDVVASTELFGSLGDTAADA
jgi:class 3 adenylate cyclase